MAGIRMFGIGTLELCFVLMLLIVTLALCWLRNERYRWCSVGLACFVVAAVVTPADLYSMLAAGTLLLTSYVAGTRHYQLDSSQS